MRDDQVQSQGAFPISKGSRLQHEKLIDFIGRNYEPEQEGRWFFQNGPQRVYVELEATPWIWRIQPDETLQTHTGRTARMQRCFVDEFGYFYVDTEIGFGLVHTQDMHLALGPIESGLWVPQEVTRATLSQQFGYIRSPQMEMQKQMQKQMQK